MRKIFIIALIGLIFASCEKDNTPPPPTRPKTPVSRTMLIYMSANNDLAWNGREFDKKNMTAIKSAVAQGALNGGRILILWRQYPISAKTQLIEVFRNSKGEAEEFVLKRYPDNSNASDAALLRQSIEDMKEYAPASRYCLDLWSHSLGWIPANGWKSADAPSAFSFGDDDGRNMNIDDMANAIDKDIFDFILFDCCLMGNIETLYQIRDKTPYVIASPAEITGEGMPYDEIVPIIFRSETPNLKAICDAYYQKETKYGVVSLYDMNKIEDVATAYKEIISQYRALKAREDDQDPIEMIPYNQLYSNVQPCYNSNTRWSFDMRDLSRQLTNDNADLQMAITSMVIYKQFRTNGFVTIDQYRFCGLSASLPLDYYNTVTSTTTWTPYYKTLDWYKRTYNQ